MPAGLPMIGLTMAAVLAATPFSAEGASRAGAPGPLYRTVWEAPSGPMHFYLGERASTVPVVQSLDVPRPSRSTRELVIQVEDGTCYPSDPRRLREVAARFDHATVIDTPTAVRITVWMRPEPRVRGFCAGVGVDFLRTIRLPSRVGRRALVNGGPPSAADELQVVLPALR